jgi:hypothetical protein
MKELKIELTKKPNLCQQKAQRLYRRLPALSHCEGGCASRHFLAGLDFGSALQTLLIASQIALVLLVESQELCRRVLVEGAYTQLLTFYKRRTEFGGPGDPGRIFYTPFRGPVLGAPCPPHALGVYRIERPCRAGPKTRQVAIYTQHPGLAVMPPSGQQA